MTADPRHNRKPVYFRGYRRHSREMSKKMRSEKKNFSKLVNRLKSVAIIKSSDKFRERWVKRLSVIK
jgi:hypothetical protein